jgi:hypothetical protein
VSSRVLFEGPSLRIGAFASRPSDRDFADSGPTRGHLVVFPRTCVSIQHADRAAIVADPTLVMIYNRGQVYTRRAIAPAGDHCTWFAFDAATILEARGDRDGDRDRPFGALMAAPSTARMYLRAHAALRRLDDPLFVEETTLALLDEVLAPARELATGLGATDLERVDLAPAHRALADAARCLLARRFTERTSLQAIAGALGTSRACSAARPAAPCTHTAPSSASAPRSSDCTTPMTSRRSPSSSGSRATATSPRRSSSTSVSRRRRHVEHESDSTRGGARR